MLPSPSPEYKHFCRVCNKGFICGSALGGHMKAHGARDDVFAVEDDSPGDEPRGSSDDHQWKAAGNSAAAATQAYTLGANPNRLVRSCQVCKNCGKEFTSWELFLEHGRCSSDDEGGPAAEADGGSPRRSSSPPSDATADGEEDPAVAATAWSKGKRSRRVKLMIAADDASAVPSRRCASGGEEDLANCLVMLSSSSNVEHDAATVVVAGTSQQEPSASASKERDRGPQLRQPISFLPPAPEPVMGWPSAATKIQYVSPAPRGMFECKACKKVFSSHQALGGHRASHKKVKGCFAARIENNAAASERPSSHTATTADPNNDNGKAAAAEASTHRPSADANRPSIYASADSDTNAGTSETAAAALSMALAPVVHEPSVAAAFNVAAAASSKKNAKMHECSVCHRLFTSGQALGGHKRCHWLTTPSRADPTNPVANLTVPPLTEDLVGAVRHQLMLWPVVDAPEHALDLTITAKPSPPVVVRAEPGSSSFHLDASVSANLHLQSPVLVPGNASHRNRTSSTSGYDCNDAAAASTAEEDESDSTTVTKRARLTDIKDAVRMDGETTEPWLQVGIGSSSAGGDDKSTRE